MLPALTVLTLHAFLTSSSRQAYATLTNITIDDTNSTYWTFVGSYNAVTPSTPCSGCIAQPDPGLAHNSSWHDGALRSGSFIFQGTAVYIYGIDVPNPANVTFAMSNPSTTSFHYYSGDGYIYNSLFFSAHNLDASVQHTVTWLMETSSVGGQSALFDWAMVTVNQADASSSSASISASTTQSASTTSSSSSSSSTGAPIKHKSQTGTIVGAVVGVVGGLALLGALFIFLRCRRSSAERGMYAPPGGSNAPLGGSNAPPRSTSAGPEYVIEPYQPPLLASDRGFTPPSRPLVPSADSDSTSMSALSMAAVGSAPVSTASASASSKFPPAPVVMAWDSNDPSGVRARDLAVEERLQNLEELAAASRHLSHPPAYS